ncbi:flagellar biosynthesis anti-sigma factor FlgM [Chitinispirillales bacterium ANBcel5]|uniref:flagellar biosynthesis anti-sigma factor FlgM n=1 Tax=Cellulosispirillum alkaliphilum TaxID=3039283 RepID=UPI002A576D19|nr:flagellar biosynthesis anti-sigma factor FlgM [Chitinispirillales bacterium ANBcel5]
MRISAASQSLGAEFKKVEDSRKTEKQREKVKTNPDSPTISAKGQRLSETKAQMETIAATLSSQPEVRAEKIAEVREKIENGFYDSEEFMDSFADKLLNELGVKKSDS